MDKVTVLHPDALVVLGLLVQSDVCELLLEFECISHLVKQEGDHNIAPATVGQEALLLCIPYIDSELVAVRQSASEVSSERTREVEQRVDP